MFLESGEDVGGDDEDGDEGVEVEHEGPVPGNADLVVGSLIPYLVLRPLADLGGGLVMVDSNIKGFLGSAVQG